METIKNSIESITEFLNECNNDTLVNFHNIMCQNQNNSDSEIFQNDEDFFQTYFSDKLMEAIRAISYGDYNYSHEFVMFDGYANLQSFNDPEPYIDIPEIAEDIQNSPSGYDIELEDEEEEEEAGE